MNNNIGIYEANMFSYPDKKYCFRPGKKYPEYVFEELSEEDNPVYDSVRECLKLQKYDKDNLDTVEWNPLKEFIKPGNNVLIKPNLVMDRNGNEEGGIECLYTQPSVVAAVIDYVVIALTDNDGIVKGNISVGDAPMQECDFERLISESGYDLLMDYYKRKGIDIELIDFRELKSTIKNGIRHQNIQNSKDGIIVNLGKNSEFYGDCSQEELNRRITNYDPRILPTHYRGDVQEYYISRHVLEADVVINMPKPKTHRKAGVTIAMKNMVGINVRKEYLPHHTMGAVESGGDEYKNNNHIHAIYSKLLDIRNIFVYEQHHILAKLINYPTNLLAFLLKKQGDDYSEGSWYGNRTISRTIADLNKILLYADKTGVVSEGIKRNILVVADMIISGEKEGPVEPSPKNVGIIAIGENQLSFDRAICKIMGFDEKKVHTIDNLRKYRGDYLIGDFEDVLIKSNSPKFNCRLGELKREEMLQYIPTSGWKGHIEL